MLYSTLDISLLNDVDYNLVDQTSDNTVRINNDNTLFIISFPPDKIPAIAEREEHYTHTEMYNITINPDNGWIEDK